VSFFFAKWLGAVSFLALFLGCGVVEQASPFTGISSLRPSSTSESFRCSSGRSSRPQPRVLDLLHPVAAGGFPGVILPADGGLIIERRSGTAAWRGTWRHARGRFSGGLVKGAQPDYPLYYAVL
jgi:hypothetical protein